jgi:putative ABC transport system substrate-binding protein
MLVNVNNPASVSDEREVRVAAKKLAFEFIELNVQRDEDIVTAFDRLKDGADALYVPTDPLLTTNRARINKLALGIGLPTIFSSRTYVDSGGLISYGPNLPDLFRRAGDYVDKILRGAKAANIPVEQPTKFDLVVNMKTAKALSLTVPPSVLARADDVIE